MYFFLVTRSIFSCCQRFIWKSRPSTSSFQTVFTGTLKIPEHVTTTFTGFYSDCMGFFTEEISDFSNANVDIISVLSNSQKPIDLITCVKVEAAWLVSSNIFSTERAWHWHFSVTAMKTKQCCSCTYAGIFVKGTSGTWISNQCNETRPYGSFGWTNPVSGVLRVSFGLLLSDYMDPESRKQFQLDHPLADQFICKDLSNLKEIRSLAPEVCESKVKP